MKRFRPVADRSAYLVGGTPFPREGAAIDPFTPFYARQIAEGDLEAVPARSRPAQTKRGRAATYIGKETQP